MDENGKPQPELAQPEPAQPELANPYQTIIEQQQAQIDALIAQTTALNSQIINMVNNGAQFNDANPSQPDGAQSVQLHSLADDVDYSLESLAKEIGRRNG